MKADNPNLGLTEMGKVIGSRWKELSDEDKKPYFESAAKDRERAAREMAGI